VLGTLAKPDPTVFLLIGAFYCVCSGLLIFGRKLNIVAFIALIVAAGAAPILAAEFVLDLPVNYLWIVSFEIAALFLVAFSRSSSLSNAAATTARLVRTPVVLGGVLFLAGAGTVVYAWFQSDPPSGTSTFGQEPELEARRDYQLIDGLKAKTDRGSEIPLYQLANSSAETIAKGDQRLVAGMAQKDNLIRIAEASAQTNCHGWVFAGGLCWLSNDSVDVILMENGYQQVDSPSSGDIVIYRDDKGVPIHSGVVRSVWSEGRILVESKWGTLGTFVHFVEHTVYSNQWTFHRTQRPSHILRGLPQSVGASARLNRKG
jgi:hypothetical protein